MSWKNSVWLTAAAALVLSVGCGGGGESAPEKKEEAAPTSEVMTVDPATAATITGKVNFEGTAPAMPAINMSAEPDCKKLHGGAVHADQVVVNSNNTLKDVFVWVKGGLEGKKFPVKSDAVTIDQKGCIYAPHVVAVQAQQKINVLNSDPMTHNINPLPKENREWNKSQAHGAAPIEDSFPRQEIMMPVKCNIHPWMRSYINVVDHPFFAVTGDDGSFTIPGLPPGTYTVEAQHEKYGAQEMSVTVAASESKEANFTYKGD